MQACHCRALYGRAKQRWTCKARTCLATKGLPVTAVADLEGDCSADDGWRGHRGSADPGTCVVVAQLHVARRLSEPPCVQETSGHHALMRCGNKAEVCIVRLSRTVTHKQCNKCVSAAGRATHRLNHSTDCPSQHCKCGAPREGGSTPLRKVGPPAGKCPPWPPHCSASECNPRFDIM